MRELLRDRERYLLQTKKQILEDQVIRCELRPEYLGEAHFKASKGDWVLFCEEADYRKAQELLGEIDTAAFDDGEELRDKKGRTAREATGARKKLEMNIARVMLYALILFIIAAVIYNKLR